MRKLFNNFILIFGIMCFLFYIAMGLAVRFGQSLLWVWPLLGCICVVRFLLVRRSIQSGKPVPLPRWFIIAWRVLWALGLTVVIIGEAFIAGKAFSRAPEGLDAIVVLGARVEGSKPSGALRERIEAAADYLKANPDTLCIASGGQGSDEQISEAECIRRGLTDRGIAEERIVLEDKSTDTRENLRNSAGILGSDYKTVGIVTSDFHVYRATGMALTLTDAYEFHGIAARSSYGGYVHYALRELASIALAVMEGSLSPRVLIR